MVQGVQRRPGREVALLGGSFNPPHVAHLMAAYWALAGPRAQANLAMVADALGLT